MQEVIDLYVKMLTNFADINGKANLKEFWIPTAINIVLYFILSFIPVLGTIVSLILLVPTITLGIRRMRDAGFPPIYIIIPFYNIYCAAQPSK